MSEPSKKGQKVIGYSISEELYNKISDFSNKKNQKISVYMRNFTTQYFTDDDTKLRILIDLPKDKLNDENYIKALWMQKLEYIIKYLSEENHATISKTT